MRLLVTRVRAAASANFTTNRRRLPGYSRDDAKPGGQ
jgi:hypothetical protein